MTSEARSPLPTSAQVALASLYMRVAATLEHSARLAEQHAERNRVMGERQAADVELERAKRARTAAERGRALARQLQTIDPGPLSPPSD